MTAQLQVVSGTQPQLPWQSQHNLSFIKRRPEGITARIFGDMSVAAADTAAAAATAAITATV